MSSGAILLKKGCIHWNSISLYKVDKCNF
jgi:hypothetical protein